MQEIGPMMRALELQRLIEDKVSEWRERSARVTEASVADSYQQPVNFRRHTNRRKNSAEINRIIAKYSKPVRRSDEPYITRIPPKQRAPLKPPEPPERPARQRKVSGLLKFSKSEDNLANVGIMDNPNPPDIKPPPRRSKYNAKSCEDITAFVDVNHSKKSKNFEHNSILNAKPVNVRTATRLHSICEDILVAELSDSAIEVRNKADFATSTPISKRKLCHSVSETVSGFEKCSNYNSESVVDLRKGKSVPDLLRVNSCEENETKTLNAKKRWSILKQPFRKGTFDCLILWRGRKTKHSDKSGEEKR